MDAHDPIGEIFDERTLPNGLRLWRQRVLLGVLGVIYEFRPNVTIDVAGLAVKTGNTAILPRRVKKRFKQIASWFRSSNLHY